MLCIDNVIILKIKLLTFGLSAGLKMNRCIVPYRLTPHTHTHTYLGTILSPLSDFRRLRLPIYNILKLTKFFSARYQYIGIILIGREW